MASDSSISSKIAVHVELAMMVVGSEIGGQWRRLLIAVSRVPNLSSSSYPDRTLWNAVTKADSDLSQRENHSQPPTPASINPSSDPLLRSQYFQRATT